MKQITFLLCMLLIPITASWAQWTDLDPNNLPTSNTRDLSFSLDNNNVPYIAYIDGNNTNKLELKKYNGSVWESITIPNLTSVGFPFIKFDSNNTLYLAYTTQFSRIVILKQNGNTWDTIGSKLDLEYGSYFKYSLNFDNSNSPYIAYSDDNDNGYLVVKKFNGTVWEQVGTTLFSERSYRTSKLVFDNNIPYIAYIIDSKPYVKKYNGTSWELIGDTSAYNRVNQIDLQVSNNTPFLAFSYSGSSIFYLLEYNTNSWIDKSFSIGTYHLNLPKINIQDQTPYIFGFTLDINHNFRSSIAQKHNGTSWESFADGLGSIQTLNQYYDTTISNNGESTYIAFIDTSFRLVVKKHSDIAYTNIPDPNFEQALIDKNIDSGAVDGKVPTNKINTITRLDVSNKNITNLTGIEHFNKLSELHIYNNQLTNVDVSKNVELTELYLLNNQLTNIDVSKNIKLTKLGISRNKLTNLDVSNNPELTLLSVSMNNQLTTIDISKNTKLDQLYSFDNQLANIDISNNTLLTVLQINGNQLTSIDVSKNTELTSLDISNNQLRNIDVSNNTKLFSLSAYENQLTNINVSSNKELTRIYVQKNQLSSLNIKNGNYANMVNAFQVDFRDNPNLTCIQVDNKAHSNTNWSNKKDPAANYEENCGSSTTINSFTGNTNNNWTEASNWSLNHLPTTEEDIEIPSGKTVLLDNIRATINNLTLEGTLIIGLNGLGQLTTNDINYQNGAITMYNQGSIIANGTITGFASIRAFYSKYNGQDLNATKWYLASLPIQVPTVKNVMDFSTLDTTTSTKGNVGFATYNNNATGSSGWSYYKTTSNDLFYNTKGYAIKVSEESSVNYFSSSRHVGDLAPNINCAVNAGSKNNWNLLGNPYYASIPVNSNTGATTTFLSKFSDQLDPSYAAVYFWNPVTASYEVVNNASPAKYIKPMEGYFVMIKNTANNLPFDKTLLAHEPIAPNRISNEDINITLTLTEGTQQKKTTIKYLNNATNGLDVGYDAGLFNGDSSKTTIYTKLVSEDKGTPFALQCLAKEAANNSSIPLGIKTEEGKELTIKAHSNNLPKGIRILLEDKKTNTITDLTDTNSSYKVTLTTKESKNRFYLHTTAKALNTEEIALDKINIVKLNVNTLQLKGLKENAIVNIYNVQGKLITNQKTTISNTKVQIPSVATGVYLVTIKTATKQTTKKIIL